MLYFDKRDDLKVLSKKWASYIKPSKNSTAGPMCGLIKTHK